MGGSLSRTVSIDDFTSLDSKESYNEFQSFFEKENQYKGKWGKIKIEPNSKSIPKPEIKKELRKARFEFNKPSFPETPKYPTLNDEEFSKIAGSNDKCHINRPTIQYNHDLLKYLDNPILFPKTISHETGYGKIRVNVNNDTNKDVNQDVNQDVNTSNEAKYNQPIFKSVNTDSKITCGRIGKIFSFWNQSSK